MHEIEEVFQKLTDVVNHLEINSEERAKLHSIFRQRDYDHLWEHEDFCLNVMERMSNPNYSFYLGQYMGILYRLQKTH